MVILGFRIKDSAELALLRPLAAGDDLRAIVAGLGHHVLETGAFDRLENPLELLDRHSRRHGADDVLTGFHRLQIHPGVQRQRSENSYSFQPRVLQELTKVTVAVIAFVDFRKPLQTIRPQIANRGNVAVRVQVPLKGRAESSANYSDFQLLASSRRLSLSCVHQPRSGGQADRPSHSLEKISSCHPISVVIHRKLLSNA